MLSNFETPREKLMHIILAGQPALAETLANPSLVQFRQRISIVARLKPFNAEDTQQYIDHRLRVAGYDSKAALFTKRALAMIVDHSKGIPRNINNLCFNAMSLGCALKAKSIDEDVMKEVLIDLDLQLLGREPLETPKQEPRSPSVTYATPRKKSSVLSGSWLKGALSLGLLLTLAGILTFGIRRSGHFPDSIGSQTLLRGSPPPVSSPPATTETEATSSPIPAEQTEVPDSTKTEPVAKPALSTELANFPRGNSSTKPSFVVVQRSQTIFRICMDTFGTYDDQILEKIRELNPGLGRLERIRIGQKILIPAVASVRKPVPIYNPKLATVSTTTP